MCSRVSFGSHEQDEYLFYIPSLFYLNHGILYTLFYTLVLAIICFCSLNTSWGLSHLGDKELLTIFLLLCSILLYACNILYLPTPYWWTHGTQLSYFKQYCSEKLTSFHSYAQILACSGFTSLLEPFQASWAIHFFHIAFLFSEILWCHEEYRVESPTSQWSPLYSRVRAVPLSSLALPPALDPLLSPHPHPPDQETLHQGWIQMLSCCTAITLFHQ